MTDLTFAMLLSSRICHDLISPVGAFNNGLEILEEVTTDEMRGDAMNLMKTSATSASAKLQFMRMAFGAGGSVSEAVSLDEAKSLTEALIAPTSVELDWQAAPVTLDRRIVKLLLNMILIGVEALPRGGTLRVGVRREGATNLMISAEGEKVRLSEAASGILRNGFDLKTLEAKESNLALTNMLAGSLGASIYVNASDTRAEIATTF